MNHWNHKKYTDRIGPKYRKLFEMSKKKSLNRKKGCYVNNTTWNLACTQQRVFAYLAPLQYNGATDWCWHSSSALTLMTNDLTRGVNSYHGDLRLTRELVQQQPVHYDLSFFPYYWHSNNQGATPVPNTASLKNNHGPGRNIHFQT